MLSLTLWIFCNILGFFTAINSLSWALFRNSDPVISCQDSSFLNDSFKPRVCPTSEAKQLQMVCLASYNAKPQLVSMTPSHQSRLRNIHITTFSSQLKVYFLTSLSHSFCEPTWEHSTQKISSQSCWFPLSHTWIFSPDCPRNQSFHLHSSGLLLIIAYSSAPADQNKL